MTFCDKKICVNYQLHYMWGGQCKVENLELKNGKCARYKRKLKGEKRNAEELLEFIE